MDVDVVLWCKQIGDDVQEMRREEAKRIEEKREAGVVGIDRGLGSLPAAMAVARARDWAAWRLGS